MPKKNANYDKLFALSREARILDGIQSHLGWDAETYLPKDAASIRSEQRELLAGIIHQKYTCKAFRDALQKLIDIPSGKTLDASLTTRQQAALREWRRDYRLATALPTTFVKDFSKTASDATAVWRQARLDNDFKSFAPWLEKIVNLCRRKTDLIGYKEHPYDALIDLYEPYMTTAEVSKLFNSLKSSVQPILTRITKAKQVDDNLLKGHFPQEQQMALANQLLQAVGFNLNRGRLDISTHPFSNAPHPTDSRITTRIDINDLISNLMAVLHEFGHALYEMNLSANEYGSPLGDPLSHGIHESQSRFWETRLGLSKPFWTFCLPLLQKAFPKVFSKLTANDIYRAVNKVERSLIRVEADEVTYTLHVILRFELEKQLIEGSLKVKDLPEKWNSKMKELLGIVPSNDTKGCLQDMHWAGGAFGYFPSYALGNVYASHLFNAFEKAHPKWDKEVSKGDFSSAHQWLADNVHRYGRELTSQELLKKATGKKISSEAYVQYLEAKYS